MKYTLGNTILQNRLFDEQQLLSNTLMRGVMDALQTPLWRQTFNFWQRAARDMPWNVDWYGEI